MVWSDLDELAISATTPPSDYWGAINDLVTHGWGQVFAIHRDSDLLDISNYESILDGLKEKYELNEDYRVEGASHWAVGWCDTLLVRILDCKCEYWEESDIRRHPDWERKGTKIWWCHTCNSQAQYTPIFSDCIEFKERLEEYPVLDEEDYSRREYEDCIEYLEQEVGDELAPALYSWLFNTYSVCSSDEISYKMIEEWKELVHYDDSEDEEEEC